MVPRTIGAQFNIANIFDRKQSQMDFSKKKKSKWLRFCVCALFIFFDVWVAVPMWSFCCGNESFALNSTRILNNFKTIENYRFECGMWNELIY